MNLFIAFIIATLFFILNFVLISNGHLHLNEDAYILFIYVENFLNGHGIAYYPGGPHAEGATDFLWLVLLIFLGKLGFNVGTSAILLNSVGVFIISYLLNIEISNSKIKNKELMFLLYPFVFLWILQQPVVAAVEGFSVFLYMSLILLAFVSVHKEKYILYTPYISLLIALFRPDGVIIGVGFTVIGLYLAYKKHQTKQYMVGVIFGFFIGISYFIWRFNYFGNLLPLPLYVKSNGSLMSGIQENYFWIKSSLYLLIPVALLSILNKKTIYYIFVSSPVILLFIVLITAEQSQNIDFRFQAPVFIIAYYILVLLIIEYMEKHTITKFIKWIFTVYILAFILFGLNHLWNQRYVMRFFNIHQVALAINENLPNGSIITLTEAGKMGYWNQSGNHKIIDLVGLNTEFPAKNTISIRYVEKLLPDMMMYHHAKNINIKWLSHNTHVVLLNNKEKSFFINRNTYTDIERKSLPKTKNAAIIATQYLHKYFDRYDIFLVDYIENKSFLHVYAFKKTLLLRDKMHALLLESFQRKTALSYYEMLDKLKSRNLNNP